jgi:DNA-binding FrmR family transcriptional regulator
MSEKEPLIITIKKARSMLKKVQQMVEADDYCFGIMQQTLAVIGLLKAANEKLMERHLKDCFSKAIRSGSRARQREMVEEILQVVRLANK